MKGVKYIVLCALCSVVAWAGTAQAQANKGFSICKTASGAISVKQKCRRTETKINNISMLTGPAGPTGPTGAQGPSRLVGVAKIAGTGDLVSSGLGSATGISAARGISFLYPAGYYVVTFNGNFAGLTSTDSTANRVKVIVMTTAESNDYSVSEGHVISASATEIKVGVYTWNSTVETTVDQAVYLSVFLAD